MNKWFSLFVILPASVFAQEPKTIFPPDIRVVQGVAYLSPNRIEKAGLYFPRTMSGNQKLPAVLIVHGGGWTGGERDAAREINIGSTLARNGYVAMSIDYVLALRLQNGGALAP